MHYRERTQGLQHVVRLFSLSLPSEFDRKRRRQVITQSLFYEARHVFRLAEWQFTSCAAKAACFFTVNLLKKEVGDLIRI